jgi:hypothetical protein
MRWPQLDLENGIWDLGVLGAKNERAKRTPLPCQALAYLREAGRRKKPISRRRSSSTACTITGDAAEKAYKRGEALRKRLAVMQAFADFAARPPKSNVTQMRVA